MSAPSVASNKVIVIHFTSTARQGGGPNHLLSLLQLIENNSIQQFAIFPFHQQFSKNLSLYSSKFFEYPTSFLKLISLIFRLRTLSLSNCSILLHSHGPASALIAKVFKLFLSCKHIYTPHGVQFQEYYFLKKIIYILYESFTTSIIDKIIFISSSEQWTLCSHIKRFTSIPAETIENTVNPNKLVFQSLDSFKKSSGSQQQVKRAQVGMIGRITNQKNSLIIFDVARLLPHVDFIYVGDGGDQRTNFLSILNSSKLPNLTYIPNIQDLKTLYAELNLLFSPSLHEGLPYVVLEAICNYIPVVLSPIPPFTDLYKRYKSPLINFPIACNDHYPSVHDYVDCIESVLSASRYDMACDLNSTNLISHFSSSKRWSDMYVNSYFSCQ